MTIHLCHQGKQLGEFSKEQVDAMIKSGIITYNTLAWIPGLSEWKPLSEIIPPPIPIPTTPIQQSQSAIDVKKSQNQAVPPILDDVPKPVREHPNYQEGNGTKESPFVIHSSNVIRSAQVQQEIIDGIYGQGTKKTATRFYFESPRGLPKNGDLCKYSFNVNGEQKSVWFDLYLVTRLANDPELRRIKQEMLNSPESQRIQAELRQKLGLPTAKQPKGCLAIIVLFIGISVLLWFLFRTGA